MSTKKVESNLLFQKVGHNTCTVQDKSSYLEYNKYKQVRHNTVQDKSSYLEYNKYKQVVVGRRYTKQNKNSS